MVEYGSIWSTAQIFCQRCHKQRQGIILKSKKMVEFGLSLDLCAPCIAEISDETSDFRD